jgi:hypothetical protein
MTTLIELQARVADLDQRIAEWYERIAKIKSERAALNRLSDGERAALARKVSNWQEVAKGATRRKAKRIARRWGVTWEDDSYREKRVLQPPALLS